METFIYINSGSIFWNGFLIKSNNITETTKGIQQLLDALYILI